MSLTERAISVGEQLRCYYQRMRISDNALALTLVCACKNMNGSSNGSGTSNAVAASGGTDAGTGTWMRVGASDTSSRTNASTGLWMPADAERQQRCNCYQRKRYWSL